MSNEPEIRTLPAQPVAFIRRSSGPQEISAAFGEVLPRVWDHLQTAQVAPAGPPFARFLTYSDVEVEFEAGLPTAAPVEGDGTVGQGELPAGEALVIRHVGPYEQLAAAHDAAARWCDAHDRKPAGPSWESYVTDPGEQPDPAQWVTEVFVPLTPG